MKMWRLIFGILAACGTVDEDGDGSVATEDCNDVDGSIHPGAIEVCDGVDNNCDGSVDEEDGNASTAWYGDGDGDGYGDVSTLSHACTRPEGTSEQADDCDDSDSTVHPGASELDCEDPVDRNCDGSVGYADADSDGFAACVDCDDSEAAVNPDATEVPYDGADNDCDSGTKDDDLDGDGFARASDCDDENDDVNPVATEVPYDGVDNDCDSTTKDDDLDGDGFARASDCDDENDDVNPVATEVPYDGVDNDCDSTTKDDDLDGDGFFLASDCNDADGEVNPDAEEVLFDSVDNDCDRKTPDDGFVPDLYRLWTPIYAGAGGMVQNVVAAPGAPGRLYVLSDMEGLYRSDDWGKTWIPRWVRLEQGDTHKLAVDPTDPDHLILTAGYYAFQSRDGGAGWERIVAAQEYSYDHVVFAPSAPTSIYVSAGYWRPDREQGHNAILISHDGGSSWVESLLDGTITDLGHHVSALAVDPTDADHVVASSDAGGYESFDGGQSWSSWTLPSSSRVLGASWSSQGRLAISLADDTVYLGDWDGASWAWTDVSTGLPSGSKQYRALTFSPDGSQLAVGSYGARDGFFLANMMEPLQWVHIFKNNPGMIDPGWDDAQWKTRTVTFVPSEWPVRPGEHEAIYATTGNRLYAILADDNGDLVGTISRYAMEVSGLPGHVGRGWDSMFWDFALFDPADPEHLVAGVADHFAFESTTGGRTIEHAGAAVAAASTLGIPRLDHANAADYVYGDQLLFGANQGFGSSTDATGVFLSARSFKEAVGIGGGPNAVGGLPDLKKVGVVRTSSADNTVAYIGFRNRGGIWKVEGLDVALADPTQAVWTDLTSGGLKNTTSINEIASALDINGDEILMVSTSSGVFRSVDGGQNWTKVLDSGVVRAGTENGVSVLFAQSGGVLRSDDMGQTFTELITPSGLLAVARGRNTEDWADSSSIGLGFMRPLDQGRVLISLHGNGIYRKIASSVVLGTPLANGSYRWMDVTGDNTYPRMNDMSVRYDGDTFTVLSATGGNGLWVWETAGLANGSCEIDADDDGIPDAWTPSGLATWSGQDSVYGLRSLEAGRGGSWTLEPAPVSSGDYTISLWSSGASDDAQGELAVRFLDDTGAVVQEGLAALATGVGGQWIPMGVPVQVPGGVTHLQLEVTGLSDAAVRVDHLRLDVPGGSRTPSYDAEVVGELVLQ